jgi:hypothetical protein
VETIRKPDLRDVSICKSRQAAKHASKVLHMSQDIILWHWFVSFLIDSLEIPTIGDQSQRHIPSSKKSGMINIAVLTVLKLKKPYKDLQTTMS